MPGSTPISVYSAQERNGTRGVVLAYRRVRGAMDVRRLLLAASLCGTFRAAEALDLLSTSPVSL